MYPFLCGVTVVGAECGLVVLRLFKAIAIIHKAVPNQIPPKATWNDSNQFFCLMLSFFIILYLKFLSELLSAIN